MINDLLCGSLPLHAMTLSSLTDKNQECVLRFYITIQSLVNIAIFALKII